MQQVINVSPCGVGAVAHTENSARVINSHIG
jgi:hypothetical protein